MPKRVSYAAVAIVAFLAGDLSSRLVDHAGRAMAEHRSNESQAGSVEAAAVAPREFEIEGIVCQGCADVITSALTKLPGVQSAKVSLADKRAVVSAKASDVPTEKILAAIVSVGYNGRLASDAVAKNSPPSPGPAPYPADMNKKFVDPNADIEQFVKRFENESRSVFVKRRDIVRSVGLRRGDAVADIGAGTGLFTLLFADRVGKKGTVYAVDIAPAFLKYIAGQAEKRGYEGIVTTVLNTQDSAMLPHDSIDVAFLCDTYHHFEHPAKMLASIHQALRPEGRLILVDFDLRKDSSEFVKKRARASKEVYSREITAAGFEPINVEGAPAVDDTFYAAFRRVESKP